MSSTTTTQPAPVMNFADFYNDASPVPNSAGDVFAVSSSVRSRRSLRGPRGFRVPVGGVNANARTAGRKFVVGAPVDSTHLSACGGAAVEATTTAPRTPTFNRSAWLDPTPCPGLCDGAFINNRSSAIVLPRLASRGVLCFAAAQRPAGRLERGEAPCLTQNTTCERKRDDL